jgi:hypothetical protein
MHIDMIAPGQLGETEADTLWIIDTLDHLPNIEATLGSRLSTVDRVLCENLRLPQRQGGQGFHQRRSLAAIAEVFSRQGLHLTRTCNTEPVMIFTRVNALKWMVLGLRAATTSTRAK